ncbi:YchJ family protein [Sulfurimonas diazotrophicus]|uniref:YchJ family protein n=1 Tax=Sulfurimonas diazotrophicus TaxID=3131939 RepID=A0ABZ3H8E6_9BACT
MQCYCGSGKTFEACCAPLIDGIAAAPGAEALMRSRYSAYVVGAGEYLVATTVPQKQVPEDAELIRQHAEATTWLGLEVLASQVQGADATVNFKAFYREGDGPIRVHHEKSTFRRIDGRWYYDEGTLYEASVGRNDPCPCGSGKKYKKCCMV